MLFKLCVTAKDKEGELNSLLYSLKKIVQVSAHLRGHLIKEIKDLIKNLI